MIPRPQSKSSRLRPAPGPRHPWVAPNAEVVDLPVVLDVVTDVPTESGPRSGNDVCVVEATVDLVGDEPAVVSVVVRADNGINPRVLQAKFRWATPLDVVTKTVPQLLARGEDPFHHDFATHDYPDAANIDRQPRHRLSDEFLEDIARRYVDLGRGYAEIIADERDVSPRTVVSWVEKARARGILSAARPGAISGNVVPAELRPAVRPG